MFLSQLKSFVGVVWLRWLETILRWCSSSLVVSYMVENMIVGNDGWKRRLEMMVGMNGKFGPIEYIFKTIHKAYHNFFNIVIQTKIWYFPDQVSRLKRK